jgi:endonuclease/exonuclease/phosphatase (EEP) superfamily protein YafD
VESGGLRRIWVLAGWLVTAAVGLLMLTQASGWDGFKFVAIVQALTPYLLLGVAPIAVLACWTRTDRLAVMSSLVGVSGLILAAPLVFAADQPAHADDAAVFNVAAVNLLFNNPVVDEVADELLALGLDAILLTEYTPDHRAVMRSHPLSEAYPYKIESDGQLASGIAFWSRYPITEEEPPRTFKQTLYITVEAPDGPVRVLGVHPPTPIFRFDSWLDDLNIFGEVGRRLQQPTLIIGDFNASYWHPAFRDILNKGFTDAHTAHGRGFSSSWPTDEWVPAFVRLDHALTGNGLVSTGVEDFAVPGSDHRGFVVSVVRAR